MNIKKILTAGFAGMILASGFATAAMMDDTKFYVGADIARGNWGYSQETKDMFNAANGSLKKGNNSFNLAFGAKFHENFGAEVGYTMFGKTKSSIPGIGDIKMKANNLYFDVIGYAPVADKINLLGSLGFGRMQVKSTELDGLGEDYKKSKTGLRAGIGAQYSFDECLAARLMVRTQKTGSNNNHLTKSLNTIGAGVTYTFM